MEKGVTSATYNERIYQTGYRREYCEMIIKYAEEGKNVGEFAAKVNVCHGTVVFWATRYPEFRKAKETAKLRYKAYWEELKRTSAERKFRYTEFLFMMVGNFGYRNPHNSPKSKVHPAEGGHEVQSHEKSFSRLVVWSFSRIRTGDEGRETGDVGPDDFGPEDLGPDDF